MKTLKHALRTTLLALALIGTASTASAYDFMVNGIYYNKNGDKATVTYQYRESHYTSSGNQYYNYFNSCSGNVTIPETVTYDGETYTVTAIGDYAFCHTNSVGISGITIPNTVTSIGKYAFQECNKLFEIVVPESVGSIGEGAFYNCNYITNIAIPNSVSSIGSYAFYNCVRLKSVIIGKSVSSIGNSAFGGCSLAYLISLATTPPFSSNEIANSTAKLYVPIESVELYRTTTGWNYFTDVRGFGDNYFSMPDVTTFQGDTFVIPVSMENVDDITAFQTDIYLPDGFELLKDGDEYMVSLSNRKGRDHVIMANDAPDGAVRVLSYSPTLKTFKENEGVLFYLTIKVPDDADGDYRFELNNTVFTTADEEEVHALNAANKIKVFSYTLGDVNNDGIITVADVVATARYILNQNPEPFVFEAADITGDGKISITDVVKIAHLVLDADYDEPAPRMNMPAGGIDRMGGEFNNNTVSINLDNEQEFTAFQLDISLPDGMRACDFALSERANDLSLNVKDRGNGKIRLMGYTADLKSIKGREGDLLSFNVAGEGEILVNGIQLVTPDGTTVILNGFTIKGSQVTAVNELADSKVVNHIDYYNLAGQRIEHPESGVNLVVTTYTDGTRTTTKVIK